MLQVDFYRVGNCAHGSDLLFPQGDARLKISVTGASGCLTNASNTKRRTWRGLWPWTYHLLLAHLNRSGKSIYQTAQITKSASHVGWRRHRLALYHLRLWLNVRESRVTFCLSRDKELLRNAFR